MTKENKNHEQEELGADQQAALHIMYKEAFLPNFFGRLAERRFPVNSEADAEELLKLADRLADIGAGNPAERAAAEYGNASPFVKAASAALDELIAQVTPSDSLMAAASALRGE